MDTTRYAIEGRARLVASGLVGLAAATTAVAAGHLVAALTQPAASPLFAVGSTFIDLTPEWLKSFAIATFGSADKAALLGGVGMTLAVVSIGVGVVSDRHLRAAVVGVGVIGLVAAGAALLRPTGSWISAVPSAFGAVAGIAVLVGLRRVLDAPVTGADAAAPAAAGRRRFLGALAGVGVLSLLSGGLAIAISNRRTEAASSGAATTLPTPIDPAPVVPTAVEVGVDGISPFMTPNADFYRVDTALEVPVIPVEDWRLRIHGMVDREVTLTFDDLLAMPARERDITLTCVSNVVGGPYVGNARWIGVPLDVVLERAGVQPGADQIVSRSIDGMTIGTPTAVALDGRDAMLVIGMNGEPLPPVHGAPVRMLVPGLYGYVSATKWLVDIELTTFDAYDPYWVQRGWDQMAPIKTMSRIDTPTPLSTVPAGPVAIGGVAWAQHVGIHRVEVRIDDGDWLEADLGAADSLDTWRQWTVRWDAAAGRHTIAVRATDRTGVIQAEDRREPFPNGATGWHSIVLTVA
jgi:DMSO/TMAO reductase YedYZ molybdopterin-dependent catalytic subunit